MKLSWDGGFSSIIFNTQKKEIICYETDVELMHQEYGGKKFYSSLSGLSGKGYITKDLEKLIELGSYRRCKEVKKIKCTDELYCYVPTLGHKGLDFSGELPTVITNEEAVIFVRTCGPDIIDAVINFKEITDHKEDKFEISSGEEVKRKEIKISNFRVEGYNDERTIELFRYSNAPKGCIDILSFVDRQSMSHDIQHLLKNEELKFINSPINNKLGAYFCPHPVWGGEECWLGINEWGFFDHKWANDPREIIGDLGNGWHGEGNGLIWKRKGLKIYALQDREEEQCWEQFEIEVTVFEWFSHDIEYWRLFLNTRIENKIAKKKLHQAIIDKKFEEIKEVLIPHHDCSIPIELARSVGMCDHGIKEFKEKYKLEGEEIRIGELVQHPQFEEMLRSSDFVTVLCAAARIKESDWRGIAIIGEGPEVEVVPRPIYNSEE